MINRRAVSKHFLIFDGLLVECGSGRDILKLFTAKWRLLISIGMMIEKNITNTITDPKVVGRSKMAGNPPTSLNIRMVSPKSLIISMDLTSIFISPYMF